MKYPENINAVNQCEPDFMGFIFYKKSPRYVLDKTLVSAKEMNANTKTVGVFVNSPISEVLKTVEEYKLNFVQLHGDESSEYAEELSNEGVNLIKAFQIKEDFDWDKIKGYVPFVNYFLFDTATKNYGGSGLKFNWELLKNYEEEIPFFLSGGIEIDDAEVIKKVNLPQLFAIDINSKFETEPGVKNEELVNKMINTIRMKSKYQVNDKGFYGEYGGAFIPEMLYPNIKELQESYEEIIRSDSFQEELNALLKDYVGRPTPLYYSKRLSEHYKADIYLKREDLCHTGAHKINNALGQILLAKKRNKKRIIAETGAGQHGVATATACALMGLECVVYMGAKDIKRQAPNVARMKMLGASIVPVTSGSKTLKDATNEAIRDWINNPTDTHYLIGSVVGPHPYPDMVAQFQAIISKEIKNQIKENPTHIIACIGGGSNAIGAFYHFLEDEEVELIGIEAAGMGIDTPETAATLVLGSQGVLHACMTTVLQTADGQVIEPYSISAGLDYPGIGPQHAHLHKTKRVKFSSITDQEALDAAHFLSRMEGIIPALESSHALAYLEKMDIKPTDRIIINLSGRGDKDLKTLTKTIKG